MSGFISEDMSSAKAAQSLLDLAHMMEQSTPPISRRNSKDPDFTAEPLSPNRQFVMTGVKRTRDPNLLSVLYASGNDTMAIPLLKEEPDDCFLARRARAAKMLCDSSRSEVFCTWRQEMISMRTSHPRWVKLRETFRETRYLYKTVQLVVVRITCEKRTVTSCQNCQVPSRRMCCLTPTLYYYVMQSPAYLRASEASCEAAINDFDPVEVKKDCTDWIMRAPSIYVRAP